MSQPAKVITMEHGQRAVIIGNTFRRLYPDAYSQQQQAERFVTHPADRIQALLGAARKVQDVEYDAEESKKYNRPIWF